MSWEAGTYNHIVDENRITEAHDFAEKHFIQEDILRKYTDEPYMNHCVEVANIVRQNGGTTEMICAALLHDTVEDTVVSIGQIYKKFGPVIGFYVQCLTDVAIPSDGNRSRRKSIEAMRLSMAPDQVKTIKLADILSNGQDIQKHDARFAKTYMAEMLKLLLHLTGGHEGLYGASARMVRDYYE